MRAHSPGQTMQYRVHLRVETELSGQRVERIGAKVYTSPFSRRAEGQAEWVVTRRVLAVDSSGTAEIEETLEKFAGLTAGGAPADAETQELVAQVGTALGRWSGSDPRAIRYRETSTGQLLELTPEAVPSLGETDPPLVTLWLLRALRPAVALPARPVRIGDRWQEPRAVSFDEWADVRGSETGEWLAGVDSPEPAVRLHVVQQISGSVVAGEDRPEQGTAEARFHAESLTAVSLGDGRVLAAARSATREVVRTLEAVAGLKERPRFVARLSVQVAIEELR